MNKREIRILLVDDESDFTQAMALWFKSRGYSVSVVYDGESALRSIKKEPPGIVFLDIIMPHMNGYTVMKLIREFNKTLPVVFMSAHEEESEAKKKTSFYGVFAFFNKTSNFIEAEKLLNSALNIDEA
ncbi:MAG: response regulator [Candidatus Omnitrophica bacterium]|nr:response regulator [Candidatus Omnitrophota bacterium]MBU1871934.1 response regulator [Candidatus Omnitrophota bacterium]